MQGSVSRALLFLSLAVASPAAWGADCSRPPGVLPNPALPPGTPDPANPIEHIVVIMQENHSFDNYFGKLNDPGFYGSEVDGVDDSMWNPRLDGTPAHAFRQESYCVADPDHGWDVMHYDWNWGKMDRFVINNTEGRRDGARVMGYYNSTDLNYYYALANEFAIGDRYFCSVPGPTLPNRYFLIAGSAFGHIQNDLPPPFKPWKQKTIFDLLQQHGVSWKYYFTDWPYLALFETFWKSPGHISHALSFKHDLEHGKLPAVSFVESSALGSDEHPPNDIQTGQKAVAPRINDLINSPYWKNSVLFLTYDESGGYFDHVAPPDACSPGDVPAATNGHFPDNYERLGFRVPFIAVSPYVKHHHVSHETYDHTSILRYIENKFNLPSLTLRDANANGMEDLFDYANPVMERPVLPEPYFDWDKAFKCIIPPSARTP